MDSCENTNKTLIIFYTVKSRPETKVPQAIKKFETQSIKKLYGGGVCIDTIHVSKVFTFSDDVSFTLFLAQTSLSLTNFFPLNSACA